jgi:hypothetical protein
MANINKTISSVMNEEPDGLKNVMSHMKDGQVDTLTSYMWNFAKEHHQKILDISVKLAESLGFKKTAEFLRVVEFFVQYIRQVVGEVEEKYQSDLQIAQTSQGENFNREQFDNKYHIQGNRMQNFITTVLTNCNTPEALRCLKAAFLRFMKALSESEGSDKKGADSSSHVETTGTGQGADSNSHIETTGTDQGAGGNSHIETTGTDQGVGGNSYIETTGGDQGADDNSQILYKKCRDFKNNGDLSDNEIYMIAQEVTGLYLYEGNAELFRDGMVSFVTVTNPHNEPFTVIVNSNVHDGTVTASLVL